MMSIVRGYLTNGFAAILAHQGRLLAEGLGQVTGANDHLLQPSFYAPLDYRHIRLV